MAIIIVVDNCHLLLTEEEFVNLTQAIRQHKRFENCPGEDEYIDSVISEFDGAFLVNEIHTEYFEILYTTNDTEFDAVGYLHYSDIEKMLLNEIFLINQINRIRFKIDKCMDDLIDLANTINYEKRKNFDIRCLLRTAAKYNGFAAEMLINHFDFFSMGKFLQV